ncbi:MAG: polymerase sigma factor FliA [Actinomycetota bacterium]|nr:polymerase sigma factor FliA [Actinomycetota bacterium]
MRFAPIGSETLSMRTRGELTKVDDLVQRYRPLAEQLTSMLLARVPRSVDRGDLQSAAMFGLFQAAKAWEPERGVTFEQFARHRIRGALLDELRGRDWASRRVRSFARSAASASDELSAVLGRRPTDIEVAARMGVTVTAIEANERDLQRASLRPSDVLTDDSCNVETSTDNDPEAVLVQREQFGYLHDAVALLPERLRRVILGYYVDELPMQALAAELGVTESRISQMRAEAVRLLRAALAGHLEPDRLEELTFGDYVSERGLAMSQQIGATSDYRERLGLRLVG